jgi:periplasmic divalent cation tolerance protein
MDRSQVMVVLVTAAGEEEADRLAGLLLDQRLIACATIVPCIRSVYRWKGQREHADESLLVLKTTAEVLEALTDTIREHHSYEVPEVIALPVTGGNATYLEWVASELRPDAGRT